MTQDATLVRPTQHLGFMLDQETFAFEVLRVREVLEVTRVTRMPHAAPFMIGVINLRGAVVPVVDLRLKFGLPASALTIDSAIIILEAANGDETVVLGALVDSVTAVLEFEAGAVEPAPKIGMRVRDDFIAGIAHRKDHFVILLDAARVFSREEMEGARREEPAATA